jgi:anti-anti-sigma factor
VTGGEASLADFGLDLSFVGEQAVIAVRRDVDLFRGTELSACFDSVIASGYLSVLLDLAELDFMDIAGLRVVAYTASRLIASGGDLTIRSPAALINRTLDITWLDRLANLEFHPPARDHLGAEQPAGDEGPMMAAAAPGPRWRPRYAVRADDEVVHAALQVVADLAQVAVLRADGVSVSLRREGVLATVAATDKTVSDMDREQYATGEGPCVEASIKGRWFHVNSLDEETRWPSFTPRAKELGINAILSTPLAAGTQTVGALNIYSRTPAAFTAKDRDLALVFATEASTILTTYRSDRADERLA